MSVYTFPPGGGAAPVAPGDPSYFIEFGAANQAAVKGSPGRVFSASVFNYGGPQKYFGLFDIVGAIGAAVPRVTFAVPAGATVVLGSDFFGPPLAANPLLGGLPFLVGIRWGWSTTLGGFTGAPLLTGLTQIVFV
jgi:hypothetical protein